MPGGDFQAAGPAHHDEAPHPRLIETRDQCTAHIGDLAWIGTRRRVGADDRVGPFGQGSHPGWISNVTRQDSYVLSGLDSFGMTSDGGDNVSPPHKLIQDAAADGARCSKQNDLHDLLPM